MDTYNKNNNCEQQQQQQQQTTNENILGITAAAIANAPAQQQQQHPSLTAFEYYLPAADGDEDGDTESNKSTPYYTPLEFCSSSFEFPSPKPKHTTDDRYQNSCTEYERSRKLPPVPPSPSSSHSSSPSIGGVATKLSTASKAPQMSNATAAGAALHSPPVVNRKIRRFSLYERRSCSPQHLLAKNSSIASIDTNVSACAFNDKENTKPVCADEQTFNWLTVGSGNNSPIALIEDTNSSAATTTTNTTGSPKILGAANEANMFGGGGRLTYSPKLLASINNLNLSGSPLSALSSAGYKNGNYFKFPEIDHVVHAAVDAANSEDIHSNADNQSKGRPTESISETGDPSRRIPYEQQQFSKITVNTVDARKNRKNKNNLTIRITDMPTPPTLTSHLTTGGTPGTAITTSTISPSPSPSPKPKTPTIKSTKALSLDSAATGDTELKIIVSGRNDSHVSCNEIGSQAAAPNADTVFIKIPNAAASHLSASLNQLSSSHALAEGNAGHALCGSALLNKTFGLTGQRLGEPFVRSARRRVGGSASGHTDWYQRQQHTFLSKSLNVDPTSEAGGIVSSKSSSDATTESAANERPSVYTKVMQTANTVAVGGVGGVTNATNAASGQRGPFKHNPLLHASNTNLKTLPEFLTLVEFSNSKDTTAGESPYKQKSIDLPSSSSSVSVQTASGLRVKPTVTSSTSSTNLLQRRGSNHSLTLNLHGSCSNLLGSCRSGLSVSNYSLGSVAAQSTTNLNSKSSGNLALGSANAPTQLVVDAAVPVVGVVAAANAAATNQTSKQTLFRRRGSNHSLTLMNLTATSCSSLNSFASQNSLNVDRLHLHPSADGGGGVTRTTSFITPTKTTSSSVATKRGLLERRGSNQNLTLNMGGSFGGIGTERNHLLLAQHQATSSSNYYLNEQYAARQAVAEPEGDTEATGLTLHPSTSCAQHRKFFSSESLNRANTQFSDLNQTHKRNANQVCFGSVSDLKPTTEYEGAGTGSREHFDFQESTVCTCTGVRNIGTRPLSPQTTSEEFKIYLANIQMLQNASNALNQLDLIKLNYIFDSSYLANNKAITNQPLPVLNVHESKEAETPPGLMATSEDHEVAARFQEAVADALTRVRPDDNETKRLFCDLHKEFWDLPLNHQEKPMVFGSQAKNRYKTILPNENSRVLLEKESNVWTDLLANYDCLNDGMSVGSLTPRMAAMTEEVPYINANYIKGPDYNSKCYVATQGPLPNTIFEFWLMVYLNTQKHLQNAKKLSSPITKNGKTLHQYYQKIVMLTNFLENNRQKCATYFPVDLNEILVVMPKHEVLPPCERLKAFLNEYLQADDDAAPSHPPPTDCEEKANVSIEFLKTAVTAEQSAVLPKNTNFFAVKNVGIVRKNGFSIRKLIVLYCMNIPTKEACGAQQFLIQKFRCYHYWYPDWPDHRSPRDINTLLDICLHVLNLGKCELEFDAFADSDAAPAMPAPHLQAQEVALYQQDIFNSVQPLPIIHCSAGIGRTGCFTAILNGIRQLRQSLAYSLTSMAAAATSRDHNGHVLSPVDFCLPADFVADQQPHGIAHILSNDTDSSFTQNTLLYLKYILERNENGEQTPPGRRDVSEWQLPSLNELPKMPDVFVDILGIVCNLRLQRGGMVQNSEQYELIHRAICLYMKRAFALKRF